VATFSLYKVVKIKIKKGVRVKMLSVTIPIAVVAALSALLLARKAKLKEVRVRR